MRLMDLDKAMTLHDAFYNLPSEDPYEEYPYEFPTEHPFIDFDHTGDNDE